MHVSFVERVVIRSHQFAPCVRRVPVAGHSWVVVVVAYHIIHRAFNLFQIRQCFGESVIVFVPVEVPALVSESDCKRLESVSSQTVDCPVYVRHRLGAEHMHVVALIAYLNVGERDERETAVIDFPQFEIDLFVCVGRSREKPPEFRAIDIGCSRFVAGRSDYKQISVCLIGIDVVAAVRSGSHDIAAVRNACVCDRSSGNVPDSACHDSPRHRY